MSHSFILPYQPDSSALFGRFADAPWAVFLDSGTPDGRQGRYDILSAWPESRIRADWHGLTLSDADGERRVDGDLFFWLRRLLGQSRPALDGLPFSSGLIGYLGYDLGLTLDGFKAREKPGDSMPLAAFGLYAWAVVVDHRRCESRLIVEKGARPGGYAPARLRDWLVAARETRPLADACLPGGARSSLNPTEYRRRFARIQRYIHAGDCYQVNFAQRFETTCDGDSWTLYQRLRQRSTPPYAAYLHLPFADILSMSPELFLKSVDGRVLAKPIKGTRPRGETFEADQKLRQALLNSGKDRAENVMIVDLLRNDIGRVAAIGSVDVPELFAIESFSNVHHLVSSVTGELAEGRDVFDLLEHSFPGGSITGAPKRRAMEIIDELEPMRRGLYCGGIGYIDRGRRMAINIVIRTMIRQRDRLWFWAGGGIVADSKAGEEAAEVRDKAADMLAVLRDGLSIR